MLVGWIVGLGFLDGKGEKMAAPESTLYRHVWEALFKGKNMGDWDFMVDQVAAGWVGMEVHIFLFFILLIIIPMFYFRYKKEKREYGIKAQNIARLNKRLVNMPKMTKQDNTKNNECLHYFIVENLEQQLFEATDLIKAKIKQEFAGTDINSEQQDFIRFKCYEYAYQERLKGSAEVLSVLVNHAYYNLINSFE